MMIDGPTLRREWKKLAGYERFEQAVSRLVMLLVSVLIVYLLCSVTISLFNEFKTDPAFTDVDALKDVFGAILTILILIEFNHSISLALNSKVGVLQARFVVLIAILVIARKVILLDFNEATFEKLIGISAIAIAFGILHWLMHERAAPPPQS